MFTQIFLFEIKYRLKKPGPWLIFLVVFLFSWQAFAFAHVPLADREHVNAPSVLAFFMSVTSLTTMLISSAIMGVPLYRDIEYSTKEYYLSYPITKMDYFFGRFLGSFLILLLIVAAVPVGAWIGSCMGKAMGWIAASRYGPNDLSYYLHPFLTISLPNMIFTSCIFFGLVAAFRNQKVIYSSGLILFLGYMISNFALHNSRNYTLINLFDPFAINPIRIVMDSYTLTQKNISLIAIHGNFLANRILWPGIGLILLFWVYARFSFESFFSGRADKKVIDPDAARKNTHGREPQATPEVTVRFSGDYHRRTLFTLTRIELLNIIRDNYFWLILFCGTIFLGVVFWNTGGNYGLPDLPLTSHILAVFQDNFLFFIFIILIFYTGETLHRERSTGYATINDSLPPPNWVLNMSKLLSLLFLALFLALVPMVIGMIIQTAHGYPHFDFPVYLTNLFAIDMPLFVEMVFFAWSIHVLVNNKFAANGIGIALWTGFYILQLTGKLDYLLLLYSYTPSFLYFDMDGIGFSAKPLFWFNLYWLFCGGLFLVVAAIFFTRGITSSFAERWQLAKERWGPKTRIATFVLLAGFLAVGSYIYYNVSYINDYLTRSERIERAAIYEQQLKRYDKLPLPALTRVRMSADLYPDERKAVTHAFVTLTNRTEQPIDSFLLDGDNLSEYSLTDKGELLHYSNPLIYKTGKFNIFRPRADTAEFRLYHLPQSLGSGDQIELEIHSVQEYKGFANRLEGGSFLKNFMIFTGGLPGMGYDEGDELQSADDRIDYHLPPKKWGSIPHGDPRGANFLSGGDPTTLYGMDITVSIPAGQSLVAPGTLLGDWEGDGRHYYHYAQDRPGMYFHFGVLSAKYAILHDSVTAEPARKIPVDLYYYPSHTANLDRLLAACKDGLRYYSHSFGPYPFDRLMLAESPAYAPEVLSLPGMIVHSENFGWNAIPAGPGSFDYCYFITARDIAGQWWGQQVAPNNTGGSSLVSNGLATYSSLALEEKKFGKENMAAAITNEYQRYIWGRGSARRIHESAGEKPLLDADEGYITEHKAALVLYGLQDLIGEDSLNDALREFNRQFAFRSHPPFAGSDDLYRVLQRHVPDSVRYYLTDTWEKTCFYQNKILDAKATPTGKDNMFKVTFRISVGKTYFDAAGNEHPADSVDDYIDLGIFAADGTENKRSPKLNPIWTAKRRLHAGEQTITVIVYGKPAKVGIDPYRMLMEDRPADGWKVIE
jgi:ABC-2 type transport system permease protein